jgi:hypothetical protein
MSLAILKENLMRNQPAPRKIKTSISITSSNKEILSFHLSFNFPMHLHSCFWIRNEIKWERRYMNKNCTSTRERQFPINSQILLILITIDTSINKTFFCPNKKKTPFSGFLHKIHEMNLSWSRAWINPFSSVNH